MKVKPVILCGGSGTRLFPGVKNNPSKQFIDFGGWTLFDKTIDRIKSSIFDYPIISTNKIYKNLVLKGLKKHKIKKFKIILEPTKKNTAPAIIASTLLNHIEINQPVLFLPSDHYISDKNKFNKIIKRSIKYLNSNNIFLFGVKPNLPRSDYGYLSIKRINKDYDRVNNFIEKPNKHIAEKIIRTGALWNSGIFLIRKDSLINNVKKIQKKLFFGCLNSLKKVNQNKSIINLNKKYFNKITPISFDYAVVEKTKEINSTKLNSAWSDLGSWVEIFKILKKQKNLSEIKKNTFHRPWGKYINYFNGKNFLLKELTINKKSSISLQKHFHRSELWTVTSGRPKITLNDSKFYKNVGENIFIPKGAIHRIENQFSSPVKIVEAQIGKVLKETDIVRYQDIYGRIN